MAKQLLRTDEDALAALRQGRIGYTLADSLIKDLLRAGGSVRMPSGQYLYCRHNRMGGYAWEVVTSNAPACPACGVAPCEDGSDENGQGWLSHCLICKERAHSWNAPACLCLGHTATPMQLLKRERTCPASVRMDHLLYECDRCKTKVRLVVGCYRGEL